MKVLVTGGAGFIGSNLCDRLVAEGHEVVVIDNYCSGKPENLAHLEGKVKIIEDSILNIGRYEDELQGVQRIYHLAALTSGYDSLFEPEPYHSTNIIGLLRLIDMVRRLDNPRLIFASSSTVYGNGGEPVKREGQQAAPLSVYALTKYMGEHTLAAYSELHGIDWVALRFFNVYGPRQAHDHPYANVTCKFAYAAAMGHGVRLYGDGMQTRDFVYIDDVVESMLTVSGGSQQRVYNVGTGTDISILRLLGVAQSLANEKLPVEALPPWPNDIEQIKADISRLSDEFGWSPKTPVEEGLARTVDWFRTSMR